jgi:hypothetical protein
MRSRLAISHSTAAFAGLTSPNRCLTRYHALSSLGIGAFMIATTKKPVTTCSRPSRIDISPLPRHLLRNGRLNQTA